MSSTAESAAPALAMSGISKSFPGVLALREAQLEVRPGEVMALLGENGAGKSTLMKILAGALSRDSGEIRLFGRPADIGSPQQAIQNGIAMIYQEFNLVPSLSVAENIFLGREPRSSLPGFVNFREMRRRAQELIGGLGVTIPVKAAVADLSVAQQQMVEIAKAASQNARIIVMDEPSATLTEHELSNLFALIRRLKSQGVSIIYISHRLEEVFEIADRVTVLRDGMVAGVRAVADLTRDEIIRMMVGREIKEQIPKEAAEVGPPILEVRGLIRRGVLDNISLMVRAGEIVGLAGLVGSGRSEMARALFGADPIDAGEIVFEGRSVRIRSPRDAIRLGIGMLTEDRKELGLVLGMSVRENTTLAHLDAVTALGFINHRKERVETNRFVTSLRIRTPGVEQKAENLSGGNQQKVVLAKWLFTQSRLLVFDEPTRGIDVGTKVEIYQLMNELVRRGAGILMISSELPEALGMSDRIYVMHEGHIAGELSRNEATQETVMRLATGG